MSTIAITKAQNNLFSIVERAFQNNHRTVISKKGKKMAAIIGPEDFNFLKHCEALEDKILAEIADESLKEDVKNISFEDMKKIFGRC